MQCWWDSGTVYLGEGVDRMNIVLKAMMMKKILDTDKKRRENMSPEEQEKSDAKFREFVVVAAVVFFAGIVALTGILFL